eukprot:CAMPEP_0115007224 /NCGR_PEP_ID=MMETSP0216-20121206/21034_1 /TAXON_ID=223996 /ORGANISM="Protocruzia adherens, Strain Boccale" /LENGTH=626 /DNA_ID=CAMNT_0002374089 /DNA_START=84 /DNA_END=1964 /DNA_ORIENTATION=+
MAHNNHVAMHGDSFIGEITDSDDEFNYKDVSTKFNTGQTKKRDASPNVSIIDTEDPEFARSGRHRSASQIQKGGDATPRGNAADRSRSRSKTPTGNRGGVFNFSEDHSPDPDALAGGKSPTGRLRSTIMKRQRQKLEDQKRESDNIDRQIVTENRNVSPRPLDRNALRNDGSRTDGINHQLYGEKKGFEPGLYTPRGTRRTKTPDRLRRQSEEGEKEGGKEKEVEKEVAAGGNAMLMKRITKLANKKVQKMGTKAEEIVVKPTQKAALSDGSEPSEPSDDDEDDDDDSEEEEESHEEESNHSDLKKETPSVPKIDLAAMRARKAEKRVKFPKNEEEKNVIQTNSTKEEDGVPVQHLDDKESVVTPGRILQTVPEPQDLKKFMMTTIPKGKMMQCVIYREKKGFGNMIAPKYHVYSSNHMRYLMSAKKQIANKTSNYHLSMDRNDFKRKSDNYLGKLRSNFMGTQYTIYDRGENPENTNSPDQIRQEMAVIYYEQNLFGTRGPRKMKGYLPKLGPNGEQMPWYAKKKGEKMVSMVAKGDTDEMICVKNKEPQWNEELGAYVLNFRGRVRVASVKNFQLVDNNDDDYIYLLFGKLDEETFAMDFQWPLCPMQAFAICLTSTDFKFGCE